MRDCKTCIHSEIGHGDSNGCTAWSCEYINKKEALRAYKEHMAIVRCKDCVLYDNEDMACMANWTNQIPAENDYCSCGRRADKMEG